MSLNRKQSDKLKKGCFIRIQNKRIELAQMMNKPQDYKTLNAIDNLLTNLELELYSEIEQFTEK